MCTPELGTLGVNIANGSGKARLESTTTQRRLRLAMCAKGIARAGSPPVVHKLLPVAQSSSPDDPRSPLQARDACSNWPGQYADLAGTEFLGWKVVILSR